MSAPTPGHTWNRTVIKHVQRRLPHSLVGIVQRRVPDDLGKVGPPRKSWLRIKALCLIDLPQPDIPVLHPHRPAATDFGRKTEIQGKRGEELTDGIVTTLRRNVGKNYRWPGNVRELEQAVRRMLLTGASQTRRLDPVDPSRPAWLAEAQAGRLDADGVLAGYCRQLHTELGSYEAVAGRTRLHRRTVRKYVHLHPTRTDAGAVPNPEVLDSRESPGRRPESRE